MFPSTLLQENTFLFERLTIHYSISTPSLTTHLQSSNSCLKSSARGFQIYSVRRKFNKVKFVYETALKDSQHFSLMSFNNSNTQNARRNRNRKVRWFYPSYSQNVKANISKLFVKLCTKNEVFH